MVSGLPAFIGCLSDPAVAWFHRCSDFSRPDAEAFLAGQPGLIFEADGHWFQWALERDEDGVLAGDAAVHFFDQGRRGELGVTLALEWHDRGYAQEALVSMLERLLLQRGKHRVMRQVDSRHAPIQALLRRLGFRGEGMIGRACSARAHGCMGAAMPCWPASGRSELRGSGGWRLPACESFTIMTIGQGGQLPGVVHWALNRSSMAATSRPPDDLMHDLLNR